MPPPVGKGTPLTTPQTPPSLAPSTPRFSRLQSSTPTAFLINRTLTVIYHTYLLANCLFAVLYYTWSFIVKCQPNGQTADTYNKSKQKNFYQHFFDTAIYIARDSVNVAMAIGKVSNEVISADRK